MIGIADAGPTGAASLSGAAGPTTATGSTGAVGAGLGLKQPHVESALAQRESSLWFEVHTENYMVAGGPRLARLRKVRESFPVSFHGVGASLGGPAPPEPGHLSAARRLVEEFEPVLVSEHAVWSRADGVWFADLLPLPRTGDALRRLVDGVDRYQNAIGRRILIENPTNYLTFVSEMDEPDFLNEVAERSGCGLLLDVNNVYLSARNCGIDPERYIEILAGDRVGEIHVAGHEADENLGDALLIDTHAAPVSEAVWDLLDFTLARLGPKPVLLERDGKLPPFAALMEERRRAETALASVQRLPDSGHERTGASGSDPKRIGVWGSDPERTSASDPFPEWTGASGSDPGRIGAWSSDPERTSASDPFPERTGAPGSDPVRAGASDPLPERTTTSDLPAERTVA